MFFPYFPAFWKKGTYPLTKSLMVLQVTLFVISAFLPQSLMTALAYDPSVLFSIELFTYTFAHGNVAHLASNLLFFLSFAPLLEETLTRRTYLLVYFGGGLLAALFWSISVDHVVGERLIGASGSIAAIMGAVLVVAPRRQVPSVAFFVLILIVHLPARFYCLLNFIKDALMIITLEEGDSTHVAYSAHVGGFVVGFMLMKLMHRTAFNNLDKAMDIQPEPQEGILDWVVQVQADRVPYPQAHYQKIYGWLEKQDRQHALAARASHSLGVLAMNRLDRPDLARSWFLDCLGRNPEEELRIQAQKDLEDCDRMLR